MSYNSTAKQDFAQDQKITSAEELTEEEAATLAGMIDPDTEEKQNELPPEEFQRHLILAICQDANVCKQLAHLNPSSLFKEDWQFSQPRLRLNSSRLTKPFPRHSLPKPKPLNERKPKAIRHGSSKGWRNASRTGPRAPWTLPIVSVVPCGTSRQSS